MKQTPMFLMLLLATALSAPAPAAAGTTGLPEGDKRKTAPSDAADAADAAVIPAAHRPAA